MCGFGYDFDEAKISDILSAVGLAQMNKIEKIIQKRQRMAKVYDELLSKIDKIQTQRPIEGSRHTYQSYVCYITKLNLRDKIRKKLSLQNVETQIGTYALHCLPAFKKYKKKAVSQIQSFCTRIQYLCLCMRKLASLIRNSYAKS